MSPGHCKPLSLVFRECESWGGRVGVEKGREGKAKMLRDAETEMETDTTRGCRDRQERRE